MVDYPLSDLQLARRLERAEGAANRAFVESRAAVEPQLGATWIEVAGAFAMFDGVESPVTQTFGLGLFDEITPEHLERLETFYRERGACVFHEVSPLAGVALARALNARGFAPLELASVMCRPLEIDQETAAPSLAIAVDLVSADRADLWAETAAIGWSGEAPTVVEFVRGLGRVSAATRGTSTFLASMDGRPIAAAAIHINDRVALLAGASTIPDARRQGAQQALLSARLQFARDRGCDLAMMCAAPGSASQRNAERHGFRIAYTRTKWELK